MMNEETAKDADAVEAEYLRQERQAIQEEGGVMMLGTKIREARKRAGMNQAELGRRLGIHGNAIAQWETGCRNPKYETLKRIAAALNVSVESILECDRDAYTRRLEAEKRAAVEALKEHRICQECKHWGVGWAEPCMHCDFENNRFEWRGVPEEVVP